MKSSIEEIYELAAEAGLIDRHLGTPDNPMTDYGSCGEALQKFAAMVAERCATAIERRRPDGDLSVNYERAECARIIRAEFPGP